MTSENPEKKYCCLKKPRECRICNSRIIETYLYGLQPYDKEQERKIKEGRIILIEEYLIHYLLELHEEQICTI